MRLSGNDTVCPIYCLPGSTEQYIAGKPHFPAASFLLISVDFGATLFTYSASP